MSIFAVFIAILCIKLRPINCEKESKITSNVGENVILNCALDNPDKKPISYVVQWQKHGIDVPIYIW